MTDAQSPQLISLRSADGSVSLTAMDIGATWYSCRVALPDGSEREVLLSGPTPEAHLHNTAYLGATVGRYANRIGGARIRHGEHHWALTPQPGSRHSCTVGPMGLTAAAGPWPSAVRTTWCSHSIRPMVTKVFLASCR